MVNQYCAHFLFRNWQLPFLNQLKGQNDDRKYFMIKSPWKNVADQAGVKPATSWLPVRHASRIPLVQCASSLPCLVHHYLQTSKFHGEFMSPALFLSEVLKMVKLTRGPLVLYHLPKYWIRKPVIKNNFKILKKPHAYLQTILKAPVKFQKDRLKIVVGVTGSRYLLPIRFCSIRTQKMSKLKMQKKW